MQIEHNSIEEVVNVRTHTSIELQETEKDYVDRTAGQMMGVSS